MAKSKKEETFEDFGDIFSELKGIINKRVPGSTYLLSDDNSPTTIKHWISTGSYHLDTIISNKSEYGGIPVGRVTQVYGLESVGKSLISVEACKDVQRQNGIAIYIDTEAATTKERLCELGLDPSRLLYSQVPTVEDVFEVMDTYIQGIIEKFKGRKEKPITLIVWDSVAQTSTKAEYESDYEDQQMGSLARSVAKGFRKINQFFAPNNIALLCLNQLTMKYKLANPYEYPYLPQGGKKLGFVSSVIVQIDKSSKIEGDDKAIIGYETRATVVKNKVAVPARKCTFNLLFNKGVDDEGQILGVMKEKGSIEQISAQKCAFYDELKKERVEFKNTEWHDVYKEHKDYLVPLFKKSLIINTRNPDNRVVTKEYDPSALPEGAVFDPETGEVTGHKKLKKEDFKKVENDN